MNKLWDKFLLGLSCCAFMLAEGTDPSNITTLLLAVICSAIFQIKPSSSVAYLSVIAYSSLCIFSKEALILAPLVLYDAFCTKFYPAMVLTFIGVLANIFTLGKDLFPLVALFLVSFTISSRSVLNEKLTKMLIKTRDNSKELTTQLVEKNKAMQRNQDYEIYLATLKERNRIAREIHDNVGHMLTRSILQLGALSVINKDETVGEAINDLSGTLNTAMTSIRSSVHDLHDDSIALKPAVEDCIRPLKDRFAVSCDYDFSERMSRDVKLCFIGVIKEALSMGFADAAIMDTKDLVFVPEYRQFCEDNLCGNYNLVPACPPACGTVEEMQAKALKYEKALVLQTVLKDTIMDPVLFKQAKHAQNILTEQLARQMQEAGKEDILIMSAGPYKNCSCMSAYSVDAQKMADAVGMVCWADDSDVRFFTQILFHEDYSKPHK